MFKKIINSIKKLPAGLRITIMFIIIFYLGFIFSLFLNNTIVKLITYVGVLWCLMIVVILRRSQFTTNKSIQYIICFEIGVITFLLSSLMVVYILSLNNTPISPEVGNIIMVVFYLLLYLTLFPFLLYINPLAKRFWNKNIFCVGAIKFVLLLFIYGLCIWIVIKTSIIFTGREAMDSFYDCFDLSSFNCETNSIIRMTFLIQYLATKILDAIIIGFIVSIFTDFDMSDKFKIKNVKK